EIGINTGVVDHPTNQYVQVGLLVDMWADLLEGYGHRSEAFWKYFVESFSQKNIKNVEIKIDGLEGTGLWNAPYRNMIFIRRKPVTVTFYLATQGKDLYIAWRAFVQNDIEDGKMWTITILAGVIGLLVATAQYRIGGMLRDAYAGFYESWYSRPFPSPGFFKLAGDFVMSWLGVGAFIWMCVTVWFVIRGYQRENGDFMAYFREPL